MNPRSATLAAVALVALLYYSGGIHVAVMPDSAVFLVPASTLPDAGGPLWPYGRGIGYPVVLAPLLATAAPGLAIVVAHLGVIALTYAVIRRHLRRAIDLCGSPPPDWAPWVPALLAATALYSALHALAGSVLAEIVFAALAGLAVVATARLILEPVTTWRLLLGRVLASSAVNAALVTVKPHWMIGSVTLALVIAAAAANQARCLVRQRQPRMRWAAVALAAFAPVAVLAGLWAVDREVTTRRAHPDWVSFGPRSAFCNNAHIVFRVAEARPALRLHDEAAHDRRIRAFLAEVVPPGIGRWGVLGYDGDSCLFDARLPHLVAALAADRDGQSRALLGAVARAAWADPLPFVVRVANQFGYAILSPFDRYGMTLQNHPPSFDGLGFQASLRERFFRGTQVGGRSGLMAWSDEVRDSFVRKVVRVVMGVLFVGLGFVYAAAFVISPLAAAWRWQTWDGPRRHTFLALIGVPMVAILGHHALVALVHSFDIWRYAFNMFFVNLILIAGAAIFWSPQIMRSATPRPVGQPFDNQQAPC